MKKISESRRVGKTQRNRSNEKNSVNRLSQRKFLRFESLENRELLSANPWDSFAGSVDSDATQTVEWQSNDVRTANSLVTQNDIQSSSALVPAEDELITLDQPVLTATAVGSSEINVSWDAVANNSGYMLQYWSSPDNVSSQFIDDSQATSVSVSGLVAETTYYFRMKAYGDDWEFADSPWSDTVSATTLKDVKTYTVNTTSDVVDSTDDFLSLREAVRLAVAGDRVVFDASLDGQTIALAGTPLVVSQGISIDGSSLATAGITIDAGGKSSLMTVSGGTADSPVQLSHLTLTGGKAAWYGGLLYTEGYVVAQNVNFDNGFAYYGGAIGNAGNLTLQHCSFTNNKGAFGGVVYNRVNAVLSVGDSTATSNTVTNNGGFLFNNGNATITGSAFNANVAGNRAGAVYVAAGTVVVENSTFVDNTASNYGGTVYNAGTLTLTGGSISGGSAIYGGAIANFNTLTITNCDLSANNATQMGGGIYHSSSIAVNITGGSINGNSAYDGGGLYIRIGTVRLTGTEMKSNSATHNGGGVYSKNQVILTDSVVSQNNARYYGGGVYNEKLVRLRGTTTVSGNTTETGKSQDIHNKDGGQIIYDSELADSVFDESVDWAIEL